jgi:hypothetical protein
MESDSCTTHIAQLFHNQDTWSVTHACESHMDPPIYFKIVR